MVAHDDLNGEGIPDALRLEALDRDGWMCQMCGEGDADELTLHHVIYRSQRGEDVLENLVNICFRCHRRVHNEHIQIKRIAGNWYFSH